MPTEPTPLRPPGPRVDIGGLAAGIQLEATTRLGGLIAYASKGLDEVDEPLTENQHAALVAAALRYFDGYELAVMRQLKDDLDRDGVTVWGMPDEYGKLLGDDE